MIAVTPPHVLLVEDDADTREVLKLILESEGMTVTPAHDGLEGCGGSTSCTIATRSIPAQSFWTT